MKFFKNSQQAFQFCNKLNAPSKALNVTMKTLHPEVSSIQVLIEKYSCGVLSLILQLLMDIVVYFVCAFVFRYF